MNKLTRKEKFYEKVEEIQILNRSEDVFEMLLKSSIKDVKKYRKDIKEINANKDKIRDQIRALGRARKKK